MRLTVRFGRAFAIEAEASEIACELDAGASAAALLREVATAAPKLSCITNGAVDLAVANLSINGRPVDARAPEKHELHEGDEAYLFAPISGG